MNFINRKGEIFKDLTELVYTTTIKYKGAKRELYASTKTELEKMMLTTIGEFVKNLQDEVESKTAEDGSQKTIGVYPGTKA